MKYLTGNEIRQKYLDFFKAHGHLVLPSASLIPHDDPTLLLIGAGMAPFKPFFTGKMKPPSPRITTCQKCVRTDDIENVGRTARHHTYFEMLGNFSFGDYFKKEVIPWAWEFLTKELELPADKLWITIYPKDDEAYHIWHDVVGVPDERIVRLEDNFWQIGSGPCGPDSEIHIDLGADKGCGEPTCGPGCDCGRFLELSLLSSTRTLTGPTRRSNIRISIPVPALNALLPLSKASRQTLRPILFSPSSNLLANSPIRNIMQMPKPIFRLRLLLIMLAA